MTPFWIALQFLTTLPTPRINTYGDQEMGQSVLFYPLAGLIIGLILGVFSLLLTQYSIDNIYGELLNAGLLLALWVALTGALHIDGLADCADAWMGGLGDKEKTLSILKDPTSGPIALTVVILLLLLKWLCLSILLSATSNAYFLLIPALSRSGLLLFFLTLPYVREKGIAATMAKTLPRQSAFVIIALASSMMILFYPAGILSFIALGLLFWLFHQSLLKRLQGFTGDTLGAWVECSELILLLCAVFSLR